MKLPPSANTTATSVKRVAPRKLAVNRQVAIQTAASNTPLNTEGRDHQLLADRNWIVIETISRAGGLVRRGSRSRLLMDWHLHSLTGAQRVLYAQCGANLPRRPHGVEAVGAARQPSLSSLNPGDPGHEVRSTPVTTRTIDWP